MNNSAGTEFSHAQGKNLICDLVPKVESVGVISAYARFPFRKVYVILLGDITS